MRDSLIFYRSFYEAMKELPLEQQWEIYNAIFSYWLDFQEVELNWISKTVFTLIKPQLDANIRKYKNGTKAKAKQTKSKVEAKGKQNVSKTQGNVNDNVNDNVNELKEFVKKWNTLFMKYKVPNVRKVTKKLKDIWIEKREEYTELEIGDAITNYLKEIISRKDNGSWYIDHRFTLYEFLFRKWWLETFINK